ncbi:MAG: FHA domain-containing protein [Bradymonadia bacterium]
MLRLVIEDGEGTTHVVPLARDEITVGREEGNTIRLTERNVSRRHARFTIGQNTENDTVILEDLHSYNGIFVNGERIVGRCSLDADDSIQIGDYVLVLETKPEALPQATKDTVVTQIRHIAPVTDVHLAESEHARLVVVSSNLGGQVYPLSRREIMLGRNEADGNDLTVNHRSISRNHAKIVWRDGRFTVIDLGSANGVIVNGQAQTTCTLVNGDIIEMGHVKLRFCAPDDPYVFTTADIDDVILPAGSQAVRYLMYAIIAAGMVLLGYVLSEVTRDNQTASSQIEKVGAALQPVEDAQTVKNERVVAATPIAKQPLGPSLDTQLENARDKVNTMQFELARDLLRAIRDEYPKDERAAVLLKKANAGLVHKSRYNKLRALMAKDAFEKVFRESETITQDSPYYDQAMALYDRAQMDFLDAMEKRVKKALKKKRLKSAEKSIRRMEKYDFARQEAASLQVELDALVQDQQAARDMKRSSEQARQKPKPKRSADRRKAEKRSTKPRVEAPAVVVKKPKPKSCNERLIAANGLFFSGSRREAEAEYRAIRKSCKRNKRIMEALCLRLCAAKLNGARAACGAFIDLESLNIRGAREKQFRRKGCL